MSKEHDNKMSLEIPESLKYWTADEVAECVSYYKVLGEAAGDRLYSKLWRLARCRERMELDSDGKASHWWERLTAEELAVLIDAYFVEYGGRIGENYE